MMEGRKMPRRGKQKTIGVDEEVFHYLCLAKQNFEKVTHLKTSWGGFLVSLSCGALATQAAAGLHLVCPNCEHEMGMSIRQFRFVPDDETLQEDKLCRE
jgi:hypothetical protein